MPTLHLSTITGEVFPRLARAVDAAAPGATLAEVREAALVVLYRLLFILYAEDRTLLPTGDPRYDPVSLRRIRDDIGAQKDRTTSGEAPAERWWTAFDRLCQAVASGDPAIGVAPCGGGLFDAQRAPLITKICLGDDVMADVIGALCSEQTPQSPTAVDYRNFSVQELGGVYERLLEIELVRDGNDVAVRADAAARRSSGSYYTPGDLVALIIRETVGPLAAERMAAFRAKAEELRCARTGAQTDGVAALLAGLQRLDPASQLLGLRICDPAMGAGHFLVSLADYLADQIMAAMAEAEALAGEDAITLRQVSHKYVSPLRSRIGATRAAILRHAEACGVAIDPTMIGDRRIVLRMAAARCVYGVDKNPMAVELARTALQLHAFIPGAPAVFLDHHLRCGDSLFGLWVHKSMEQADAIGTPHLLHDATAQAADAAAAMRAIDELNDGCEAGARRPADAFAAVQEMTAPLDGLLSKFQAFEWLGKNDGDKAQQLIVAEGFFNWEAAFPDIWLAGRTKAVRTHQGDRGARSAAPTFDVVAGAMGHAAHATGPADPAGFDAVIGNPPWDRMKLQQVEWFAARRRDIAMAPRAADRARMIEALAASGDPLAQEYAAANARAEAAVRAARTSGDYPLMSGGDINLYSLFVERALALVKPCGMVGLLTPSGLASDKTSAPFFKSITAGGRLRALYDFENRRTRFAAEPFFPDVDSRFRFCAFVASPAPAATPTKCAFFLQDVSELADPEKCFPLTPEDFARFNPNTGTAPLFRSRRDADLTSAIYRRLPVLADRSAHPAAAAGAWPVRYTTMFHMTNDSHLFRTKAELAGEEKAHLVAGNCWKGAAGLWLPLYEGKMAQAFDHRAASVAVNTHNRHRPAQPAPATPEQHRDPAWLPEPQYWVAASRCGWTPEETWALGFKEITSPTNERTMIAALFPPVAFGNKIPLLRTAGAPRREHLLCANLNSIVFDYVARQKLQGQTLNRFIVEQLPVVPPGHYGFCFGSGAKATTAAETITASVLELSYTSWDMAPFAAEMGFTDSNGDVRPPFAWDDARRTALRARLDAVYFLLYGVTDRGDVRYIYSTFPIMERNETARHGCFLSRDLCLAWMDALETGNSSMQHLLS